MFGGAQICGRVLANIDAELALKLALRYLLHQMINTFVVESHAIDQGCVLWQSEEARARVASLRAGRDRANFDVTETKGTECVHVVRILVEAGCKSDAIAEFEPEASDGC